MHPNPRLLIQAVRDVTVVDFNDACILDARQVEEIGQELYDLVDKRACRKIVLDFAKVRFLSSSALGVLITLKKKADAIRGRVVLCGLREELMKVFRITSLDRLLDFCPNEEKALNVFGVSTVG